MLIILYLLSIIISWYLFRLAITSDGHPEHHPKSFLMVLTFIPIVNIGISLIGVIVFCSENKKLDFFQIDKKGI